METVQHHFGILLHSAEGALLCYRTAVLEGIARTGPHAHPTITMSGRAMAEALPLWEGADYAALNRLFAEDCEALRKAGAVFAVLPDNTAHIALEQETARLPLPFLHIGEVVAREAKTRGFRKVGILGTNWTMEGPVYPGALGRREIDWAIPVASTRERLHNYIFDELCVGIQSEACIEAFVRAARDLEAAGCDAVAAVCTEIPLVLTDINSPLPVLDSTRLLAKAAVETSLGERALPDWCGGPVDQGS